MCGIVGFVSKNDQTVNVVIEGLKALEYRGYDSCGIAYMSNNVMALYKAKGKIKNLVDKIDVNSPSSCAIGHTRWATHGEPSEVNAHPHQMKSVTLVIMGLLKIRMS